MNSIYLYTKLTKLFHYFIRFKFYITLISYLYFIFNLIGVQIKFIFTVNSTITKILLILIITKKLILNPVFLLKYKNDINNYLFLHS